MIEHYVDDHRTEQGESQRNEAGADEQALSADDLKTSDDVNVTAAGERSDERAPLAFQLRHRAHEVQKAVGPEDDEDETEKDTRDVDGVFHRRQFTETRRN